MAFAFIFPEEKFKVNTNRGMDFSNRRQVKFLTVRKDLLDTGIGGQLINNLIAKFCPFRGSYIYGFMHESQKKVYNFYKRYVDHNDQPIIKMIPQETPEFPEDFKPARFMHNLPEQLKKGWICLVYPKDLISMIKFTSLVFVVHGDEKPFKRDAKNLIAKFKMFSPDVLCAISDTPSLDNEEDLLKKISNSAASAGVKKVVFWYSGHGINKQGDYPSFRLGKDASTYASVESIYNNLKSQLHMELTIVVADCCNKPEIIDLQKEMADITQNPFSATGSYLISSCSVGEVSYYTQNGSRFTTKFVDCFNGDWVNSFSKVDFYLKNLKNTVCKIENKLNQQNEPVKPAVVKKKGVTYY